MDGAGGGRVGAELGADGELFPIAEALNSKWFILGRSVTVGNGSEEVDVIGPVPNTSSRPVCKFWHGTRAGAYAEGARIGAPQAIQVADRWHLWHNLGKAIDKTVTTHHACIRAQLAAATTADRQPAAETAIVPIQPGDQMLDVCGRERTLVTRTRQRYTDIHTLLQERMSLGAICRRLGLDRTTVRRFARAATVDELLTKAVNRVSDLDPFIPHLTERFAAGGVAAVTLHAEIRARATPAASRPSDATYGRCARCRRHRPLGRCAPSFPSHVSSPGE
jgi:hypothetical protein